MNKLIFVILVCLAASAHAGAGVGSLNHILVQVEQHVGAALEAFKAHLVQLIQQFKPELTSVLSVLNDFIGKLPQLQANFVQKIKETLVNLVQMVLNGNRGVEGVKEIAEQRFFEQLQGLTTHLQTLAVSVVNHLLELLSGKPEIRAIDLSSILNNLNIQGIVDTLQGQLGNIVSNLLGQLLNGKRGFTDFIMNELGLAAVWDQISTLGSGFVSQFFAIGTELLFAGQQIWAKAKVILNQLLSDLTNHVGDASTIVAQAISSLNQILHKPTTRGFTDFLLDTLGLSSVWAELQNIGSSLLGTLISKLTQLLFAGQQAISNAKPILAQLVSDLTNHFGDASTIVAQAISSLTGVIGQRGLVDIVGNLLGGLNLGSVWTQIQSVGSSLLATLTAELAQLLVSGQQVINNAKPILQQLVSDLTNHFGDASTIVQQAVNQLATVLLNGSSQRNWITNIASSLGLDAIWDQLTAISSDLFAKLMAELAQLLFAGQAVWAQAQALFAQLVSDLTNHVGDASTIIAQAINQLGNIVNNKPSTRGFTDFLLDTLGLSSVWAELQNIGSSLLGTLISKLTQLMFAGQQAINNAKPILAQLVSDLTNHFGDASTIVAQAISSLTGVIGQRGLVDTIGNLLGGLNLGSVWTQVQSVGSSLLAQLTAELAQLLVSGQQMINNAKPILQQLVSDLSNHFGDASTIVQQAVNQLAAMLLNGQRNWISNIVSSLGLTQIWDQITSISSDLFAKLMAELTQLLFAGQAVWAQAQAIFGQLVSDLTNHVGDASTLIAQAINQLGQALNNNNRMSVDVRGFADFILNALGLGSVWDEIVGLGGNLWTQLLTAGGQLLLAGQQAINNAKPIVAQLVSDLTNHFGDASTIVAQAISSLTQIVNNNNGKRGLIDTIGNLLGGFDFSGIISQLQSVGSSLFGQLMAELTQLMFAGQQVIANAKPIVQQMINDLTNHFGDASTIVSQAVAQLAGVLGGQRGLVDIVGNLLGGLNLGSVWTQIQSVGSSLLATLTAELAQLLVSGQQVINNAKPILQQLVSDLTNHFGDASTIVQQAVNQLATVLLNGSSQRNWITNIASSLGLDAIWDQLTAISTDMFGKLMAELAKLLFAGQAVWAQAQALFAQLVSDLTNHVGDASTIIAQAINQLGNIVNQ